MPWPFVPPEPDLPSPIDREARAGRLTACRITLDGMAPHLEQAELRLVTDGGKAAVWVPHHLDGYRYSGVLLADISADPALSMEWTGNGGRQVKRKLSARDVDAWPASVEGLWASRVGDKIRLTVKCTAPASGKYQLVVAPFMVAWPRLGSHAAYRAAGDWQPVSGTDKRVIELPDVGASSYVAFIARGMPTRAGVASAVARADLD